MRSAGIWAFHSVLYSGDKCGARWTGEWLPNSAALQRSVFADRIISLLLFVTGLQVPYSKAKAMTDFALSRMQELPVTIASLGLLYDKRDGLIGQRRSANNNEASLNLIDLSLLPLTPIMVGRFPVCLIAMFGVTVALITYHPRIASALPILSFGDTRF